jgi:hypothetical protein
MMDEGDRAAAAVIALVVMGALLTLALFALGIIGVEWLDDRGVFCKESLLSPEHANQKCDYPQQHITLERGVTKMLVICRCKP